MLATARTIVALATIVLATATDLCEPHDRDMLAMPCAGTAVAAMIPDLDLAGAAVLQPFWQMPKFALPSFGGPNAGLVLPDAFAYEPHFLTRSDADALFSTLEEAPELDWSYYLDSDHVRRRAPRKMGWFAEDASWFYPFAKSHGAGLPPHDFARSAAVNHIRQLVQNSTGFSFNAALVNLYENGREVSAWHSDDDPWLNTSSPIVSVTLGVDGERDFLVKPRSGDGYADDDPRAMVTAVRLEHGSMLTMKPGAQDGWRHSLPPSMTSGRRINLTFRNIDPARVWLQHGDSLKEHWDS